MSESQDEPLHELENQFILRLPPEYASTVRKVVHSGNVTSKDKLKIDLYPDRRHAIVEVEDVSLTAKLVDLPCVIGSLKTLDKKNFYKTADVSQMLVCTADSDLPSSWEEPATSMDLNVIWKHEQEKQKKYVWNHGIAPPLKNVRKKRFRKTSKKYVDSLDVEKELKRLLYSDAEAVSTRWEVIAEDETKKIESQGSISGFEMSPGMTGHEQYHASSEYAMLQEMVSDSSSSSDENDEDEDDEEDKEEEDEEEEEKENEEEEEEDSEEDLKRELQAKFMESSQFKAKEGASSQVLEIQKLIHYTEKKLREIQRRAQRQEGLLMKVENLMLRNHLHSVLKQLKFQENEKNEQLISLREQLKYFMEK